MGLGKLLPERLRRGLLERASAFVRRDEVRRLLRELCRGEGFEDLVSGSHIDLMRTLATIRACLRRTPDVLLDVGAHEGSFSAAAARCLGFSQLICFEPDSDLNAALSRNLPRNRCEVHNVALSNRNGRTRFFVHPVKAMSSTRAADPDVIRAKFRYDPDKIVEREVEVATLDSVLFRQDAVAERSYFLKIDTQGNELEVLEGASRTLTQTDGCLIEFMFCSPYAREQGFRELIEFMSAAKFDCCGALTVMRRPSHEVSGVDFLFVRRGCGQTDETARLAGDLAVSK